VTGKSCAGERTAGGKDTLDPRAVRLKVFAGPHGVGSKDGPSEPVAKGDAL